MADLAGLQLAALSVTVLDAARTTETGLSCGADVVQPLRSENRSRSATL
ncbi:MAG: hypothetical protein ACRD03_16790 [Acidimicrobiales bacterium]